MSAEPNCRRKRTSPLAARKKKGGGRAGRVTIDRRVCAHPPLTVGLPGCGKTNAAHTFEIEHDALWLSTTEVESALVSHPGVAEAAVVGADDPMTGQGIVAFVILRGDAARKVGSDAAAGEELTSQMRRHVGHQIGPIARPRQIMIVPELPKTRSGKIMRRLLRDVAEHRNLGDVTTLQDASVMNLISAGLAGGKNDD